jgi:nucleoside 2-deoxyribosyltransferase
MKIYLASRYSRKAEMLQNREELQALGFEVVSSWLDEEHTCFEDASDRDRASFGNRDIEDVRRCDVLVCFTPGGRNGGLFCELGAALVLSKPCIIVGPKSNVFCYHDIAQQSEVWTSSWINQLLMIRSLKNFPYEFLAKLS